MSDPGADAGEATDGGVPGAFTDRDHAARMERAGYEAAALGDVVTCTEVGGRRLNTTSHELAIVV
ncbi:hypothetical protein ACFW5I_08650 [Streptomyces sp. NPDC058818]|uniref:hypothetical protein n=1 Tax=Streptomyces sp. NPDC058818 TaxID=3346640 RepID=UPI0036B18101